MLEMAHEYCDILYAHDSYAKAHELLKEFGKFRKKEPKTRSEIHLVTRDGDDMELKTMDIKKTKLDIGLMYDDGFAEIDAIIRKRLNKKEDKGIVLLHGLPGSGKTTYIRHLVGQIRKKVLFLSSGIVRKITDPDLMDLLIENPDCVLVIEDAEHLIMDRKIDPNSSVSDLLNLSDGLLADFLHVQLICTFNSPLTMVDPALLRKGRLIAKYEFGRLPVQKAQRVSDHMGHSTVIHQPMTLAEIASQREKDFEADRQVATIGFRR